MDLTGFESASELSSLSKKLFEWLSLGEQCKSFFYYFDTVKFECLNVAVNMWTSGKKHGLNYVWKSIDDERVAQAVKPSEMPGECLNLHLFQLKQENIILYNNDCSRRFSFLCSGKKVERNSVRATTEQYQIKLYGVGSNVDDVVYDLK